MLLAVDVGNTNLTVGVFAGKRLVSRWRISTDVARPANWYARRLCRGQEIRAAVCGSVVPALDGVIKSAIERAYGIRASFVTPRSKLGLALKVRRPLQVGADRILNALALREMFAGPAVAIDFGTATTFDVVNSAGDYIGGAILLGPRSAARALHEFTAKLPMASVRKPRTVIGKDTRHCLEAGLYYGYLGMIREMLRRTKSEMGGRVRVVATGGLASLYAADLSGVRLEPDLTLHGLRIAHTIMHNQQ